MSRSAESGRYLAVFHNESCIDCVLLVFWLGDQPRSSLFAALPGHPSKGGDTEHSGRIFGKSTQRSRSRPSLV